MVSEVCLVFNCIERMALMKENLFGIQMVCLNLLLKAVSPLFFIGVCIISICKIWFEMSWGKCFSILGDWAIAYLELAVSIMLKPDGWALYVLAIFYWLIAIVVVVFVFSLILSIILGVFQLFEWLFCLRAKYIKRQEERDILRSQYLASCGDTDACYRMGNRYYNGKGIEQSYEQAVKWYCKAAELGNKAAMRCLAVCYEKGLGVSRSAEEAEMWRLRAEAAKK